ncbi:MAG: GNAT family N-acetyltransferase [Sedimentitalea sp.]|uniref:GNAT family N-acetyltransferase n=1 Tax=Rhodobacterales TaxID=204455 RepID=UPI00329780E8
MMQVRTMGLSDLELVLGWAQAEGWNPGIDDAAAFFAADPEGFFLAQVDGTPAAAISVVNHDAKHAFLGLYICHPDFRGQGHGFALWARALQHAGARSVGLEGVPDQQANYIASGFEWRGKTVRCAGQPPLGGGGCRQATLRDGAALRQADRAAIGYDRDRFAQVWFAPSATRQTYILETDGQMQGFATFRQCVEGIKVGPFYAQTEAQALELLAAGPADAPMFIDVPDGSALHALVGRLGFVPTFETATMVKGVAPQTGFPPYGSVATLELG